MKSGIVEPQKTMFMKRWKLCTFMLLLPLVGMQAQRVLQIEAIPGQLSEQLTEEQKEEVGVLTLTGSLEDADFYFMRDCLPALATLHMEDADADTIPIRAFCQKESLRNIFLPKTVKYAAKDAFNTGNEVMVHVTGTYPGKGLHCLTPGCKMQVAEGNTEVFVSAAGDIYSKDKKVLHDFNADVQNLERTLENDLETIESFALSGWYSGYLIFPSGLKEIKKHAFYDWKWEVPVGNPHWDNYLVFKGWFLPVLGEEAFVFDCRDGGCYLMVPLGAAEAYTHADPQWTDSNNFHEMVEGDRPPSSIHAASRQPFAIRTNNGTLAIENAGACRLCIYDIAGRRITDCSVGNNTTVENLPAGLYIYHLQGSNIAESGKFVVR